MPKNNEVIINANNSSITCTAGSRNEQNALLLSYKLQRELQFFSKEIRLTKNEISFEYLKTKEDGFLYLKAKNLIDFTFKMVELYYDLLQNEPEYVKRVEIPKKEEYLLLLVYRFYNELQFRSKKLILDSCYTKLLYQIKKGDRLASIGNKDFIDFSFEFFDFCFNQNSDNHKKNVTTTEVKNKISHDSIKATQATEVQSTKNTK